MHRAAALTAHLVAAEEVEQVDAKAVLGDRRYVILRDFELVRDCLADNVHFSSLIPRLRGPQSAVQAIEKAVPAFAGLSELANGTRHWSINTDGELHARIRKAMPKHLMVYSQVRAVYLSPMRETISLHLAELAQNRRLDVLTLAKRVSMDMCCLVLGLKGFSREHKAEFMTWASGLARTGELKPTELLENIGYFRRGMAFFQGEVLRTREAIRRGELKGVESEGVIAMMVKDGSLDDYVLCNNFLMWLLGGFHNPANLACLSVGRLLLDPEQLQTLRHLYSTQPGNRESLLRQCVSELGRTSPPSETLVRVAECPMRIGPHALHANDAVILDVRAANIGCCPEGERVDITRSLAMTSPQLSFGYGAHKCLGFAFGQLQAEMIIERLLLTKGGVPDLGAVGLHAFRRESAGSFQETLELELAF